MRVAVATTFGCGLSWWRRLVDEGHSVRVWIQPPSHKTVGDGLVEKSGTYDDLLSWAKEGALQREPTIMLFDSSGLGEKADAARRWGLSVVGGGSFCDRLEKDRVFGQKIAEKAGCRVPPYQEFGSISDCASAAKKLGEKGSYFKTDRYIDSDATHGADNGEQMHEYLSGLVRRVGGHGSCILQEKIPGVPLSTARWWNGQSWVGPYEGTYENKKLMNDDVGPSTGCSFNAVWFYEPEIPRIAELLGWEGLETDFRRQNAPPGLYDINAIVDEDGEAWYLEWTPRLGYDSELTSARLIPDLGAHLHAIATGRDMPPVYDELAYAVRIGIPPYPWEHGEKNEKGSADGVEIYGADGLWDKHFIGCCVRDDDAGELAAAGPEGLIGLSLATGESLEDLHDEVIDFAKTLRVPGKMYRTDGAKDTAEQAEKLVQAGIEVHPGML